MEFKDIDIDDLRQAVKQAGITLTSKKYLPSRRFIGHAVLNGVEDTFEFEVPPRSDEEDIESAMVEAFFESGLVDIWCEEVAECPLH